MICFSNEAKLTQEGHTTISTAPTFSASSSSLSLPSTRLLLHPLILLVLLLLDQLVPQRHQLLQLALSELLFWIAFQKAQLVLLLLSPRFLLLLLLSLARQERLKEEDGRRSAVRTLFSLGRQVRRGDLGPAAHHRLRVPLPSSCHRQAQRCRVPADWTSGLAASSLGRSFPPPSELTKRI